MQNEKTKLETVKQKLAEHFTASRVRSVGNVIRLTTPSLEDKDIVTLGLISAGRYSFTSQYEATDCEVKVKRSGTGLAVIVTV